MLYDKILAERTQIEHEINSLQNNLQQFPPGKLIIAHQESRSKWYYSDGNSSTYLPKSQRSLAEKLALKKYLSYKLKELIQEKQAIDFYLRHCSKKCHTASDLLMDASFQSLLAPYFKPHTQELLDWSNAPYRKNPNYIDQLLHQSFSGNHVRSKSEVLIDTSLYLNKIPYRYECALSLADTTFFPDFTILHPDTKKLYYWEHFGMMDHPDYSKNAFSKLEFYNSHNIIPSINLITTFETKEHPLTTDLVEKIIHHYFL